MRQKLLVVSENFSRGGLETQVHTTYRALRDCIDFSFAFGNYEGEWDFGDSSIETGFHFSPRSSVKDLVSDTDRLVDLIRTHQITAIHAHPFYSVLPAIFAAQLTNFPLFYTYHGFGSLNFTSDYNSTAVFNFALNELFAQLFCVYQGLTASIAKQYRNLNAVYLPNAIDFEAYPSLKIANNREWAFVSRLSIEKLDGIFLVLEHLKTFEIEKLHFYGDGDCLDDIQKRAQELDIADRVVFHGHHYDLSRELDGKYNGIFAMGRAALEGIALQLPVVIVGYGKFFGLVDESDVSLIATDNFAPIFCSAADYRTVAKQIKSIHAGRITPNPRAKIQAEFDYKTVGKKYFDYICKSSSSSRDNMRAFYQELKTIQNQQGTFASSNEVTLLITKYLRSQSLDKSFLMFAQSQDETNQARSNISAQLSELSELRREINSLQRKNAALERELEKINRQIDEQNKHTRTTNTYGANSA